MKSDFALTEYELLITKEIADAVLACDGQNDGQVADLYEFICNKLRMLVVEKSLDEGIGNLFRFAVGVALEISAFIRIRESGGYDNHWSWNAPEQKVDGRNRQLSTGQGNPLSDVRSIAKQGAGMVSVLTYQLKKDDKYRGGACALESYLLRNNLWTDDDEPCIYE